MFLLYKKKAKSCRWTIAEIHVFNDLQMDAYLLGISVNIFDLHPSNLTYFLRTIS